MTKDEDEKIKKKNLFFKIINIYNYFQIREQLFLKQNII